MVDSSEAQGALASWQDKSRSGQKGRFQGVLERLLRLRQTCVLTVDFGSKDALTNAGVTIGPFAKTASPI